MAKFFCNIKFTNTMKKIIAFITLLVASVWAEAQTTTEISLLPNEKWWGGFTGLGYMMPYQASERVYNLRTENFNNQSVPYLLSNKGRYIAADTPFAYQFQDGKIVITPSCGTVSCQSSKGNDLKSAYQAVSKQYFPPSGTIPPEVFFTKPQYNTWIELIYNQNQKDVLAYAQAIIDNGMPTGVIMIDDNWQKDYGVWQFRPDKFPSPKEMIAKLHQMGFKVMVWVCPFVSPDSQEYRFLRNKGYLIKKKGSHTPAILDWWNGLSACYDLSNPDAFKHFVGELQQLQKEYGIDGFKFDAGDPERYLAEAIEVFDQKSYDTEQTYLWGKLGLAFPYNEFRACWKLGGQPLVQRLGDKSYSWDGVARLVPDMIAAGLNGYAYACPDMIGGGEYGSFLNVDPTKFNQKLIVRSCQIHAMMPMMQFSVAPWRILSKENLDICIKYAKWHEQLGSYLIEQAKQSAKTGEPIVRSMEYAFPNQGFADCKDQYMLGDKYLVAPVVTESDTRTVKLPKGTWRDDQGKKYKGSKTYTLQVPLDRLPYFIINE